MLQSASRFVSTSTAMPNEVLKTPKKRQESSEKGIAEEVINSPLKIDRNCLRFLRIVDPKKKESKQIAKDFVVFLI